MHGDFLVLQPALGKTHIDVRHDSAILESPNAGSAAPSVFNCNAVYGKWVVLPGDTYTEC